MRKIRMADNQSTRTVDDVLRDYLVIFSGRTRYVGQEPRDYELLVSEIERLRTVLQSIVDYSGYDTRALARKALEIKR